MVSPIWLIVISGMIGVFFLCFLMGLVLIKLFDLSRLPLIGHEAFSLLSLFIRGGVLGILFIRHGDG